jgi:hypothetical protein
MKHDPDFAPVRGDHLTAKKDHLNGDHLIMPIPLKANAYARSGGHITPTFGSDQGGHLSPPLSIEGVTSGTQAVAKPSFTVEMHIGTQQRLE